MTMEIINIDLEKEEAKRKYWRQQPKQTYDSSFTENINTVIKDLNCTYGQESYQIFINNETNEVEIIIADIRRNQEIINKFMNDRGYELIKTNIDNYIEIVHLIYTPKFQQDIRNRIRKERYIYCCILTKNI
jgi:hypothetical protein